jgi:hypothetical protein
MKKIILIAGLLIAGVNLNIYAQAPQTREQAVSINKANQNAVAGDFKVSKTVLEAVVTNKISEYKLGKSKSSSGFKKFEGTVWSEISTDKMDYYYRVTGNKSAATVEILASKGYDNFISSQTDPAAVQNIKNFILSLEQEIVKYTLNEQIAAKEKEVKAAEKVVESQNKNVSKAEKALETAKSEAKKKEEAVNKLKGELEKLKAMK